MSVKSQTEPPNPPPRHHLQVDLAGCTRLEAAQLLQRAAPGRIKIDASLDALEKRVTFKATMPLADLSKKLRLDSPSTTRK